LAALITAGASLVWWHQSRTGNEGLALENPGADPGEGEKQKQVQLEQYREGYRAAPRWQQAFEIAQAIRRLDTDNAAEADRLEEEALAKGEAQGREYVAAALKKAEPSDACDLFERACQVGRDLNDRRGEGAFVAGPPAPFGKGLNDKDMPPAEGVRRREKPGDRLLRDVAANWLHVGTKLLVSNNPDDARKVAVRMAKALRASGADDREANWLADRADAALRLMMNASPLVKKFTELLAAGNVAAAADALDELRQRLDALDPEQRAGVLRQLADASHRLVTLAEHPKVTGQPFLRLVAKLEGFGLPSAGFDLSLARAAILLRENNYADAAAAFVSARNLDQWSKAQKAEYARVFIRWAARANQDAVVELTEKLRPALEAALESGTPRNTPEYRDLNYWLGRYAWKAGDKAQACKYFGRSLAQVTEQRAIDIVFGVVGPSPKDRLAVLDEAIPEKSKDRDKNDLWLLVARLDLFLLNPDLLKADFAGPPENCRLLRDALDLARLQEAPEKKASYYAAALTTLKKAEKEEIIAKGMLKSYQAEAKKYFTRLADVLTNEPDAYKWKFALAWAKECVRWLKEDEKDTERAGKLQRMIDRQSSKSTAPPREGKSVAARETALG
jgi:hypothetical protein